jgi:plastocyanin
MRMTAAVAGIALMVAACGGGESEPAAEPAAAPAEAPAAAMGATHDVNMVMEGTSYMYVPAQLTIKAGDVVVFHNVSGGPHNVQFYPDSIPAGAQEVLAAAMPNQMSPLAGELLVEPNATYTISFAGAPAGEYHFMCLPHLAMNKKGVITVTP